MREALRVGAAIFNEGYYHPAHDAWEGRWLDLESGTDDERLLHGLIQYTAAIHHATERNWEGCVGLSESALAYLDGLEATYHGVDLNRVRRELRTLHTDPAVIDRRPVEPLFVDDEAPTFEELAPAEAARAAVVLADELGYDGAVLEQAGAYARRDLGDGKDDSRFISLVYDFLREDASRGVIYRRLERHVERRRGKEEDVSGLFDPDGEA